MNLVNTSTQLNGLFFSTIGRFFIEDIVDVKIRLVLNEKLASMRKDYGNMLPLIWFIAHFKRFVFLNLP